MARSSTLLLTSVVVLALAAGCGGGSVAQFADGPTIASVEPASGGTAGGTPLLIRGANLANPQAGEYQVLVGGQPAIEVTVLSDTEVECKTPPGTQGAADVEVVTLDGDAVAPSGFMYYPPPTVTAITPDAGSRLGGTLVTVTGTGFAANDPGETVCLIELKELGDIVVVDDTTLTGRVPTSWIEVGKDVTVVNRNGTGVLPRGFTYFGPVPEIYSITPTLGPRSGGTACTITGDFFTIAGGSISVRFGDGEAALVTRIDDQTLTGVTPLTGTPGWTDVFVGNVNGESSLPAGFYYIPEPFPTAVIPDEGPIDGGASVTIIGESFVGGGPVTVTFGSSLATDVVIVDDNTITCTTPAGESLGPVSVRVQNSNGQGSISNGYDYLPPAFWWEETFGTASTSLSYSGYTSVSIPDGFPFFGTDWTSVYAVNGGHLDFGAFNNTYSSANALFTFPHISAFGQMHNQTSTYNTYYTTHVPGRTIITYDRVPEYSATGANSFQIHLHKSGIFAILYKNLTGHAVTTYTAFVRIAVNPGGGTSTGVDWTSGSNSGGPGDALTEEFSSTTDLANSYLVFAPNSSGGYDATWSSSVPTDPDP